MEIVSFDEPSKHMKLVFKGKLYMITMKERKFMNSVFSSMFEEIMTLNPLNEIDISSLLHCYHHLTYKKINFDIAFPLFLVCFKSEAIPQLKFILTEYLQEFYGRRKISMLLQECMKITSFLKNDDRNYLIKEWGKTYKYTVFD